MNKIEPKERKRTTGIATIIFNFFGFGKKIDDMYKKYIEIISKINNWNQANMDSQINEEILATKKSLIVKLRNSLLEEDDLTKRHVIEALLKEEEGKYASDKKRFKDEHVSGIDLAKIEAELDKKYDQEKAYSILFRAWLTLVTSVFGIIFLLGLLIFFIPDRFNFGLTKTYFLTCVLLFIFIMTFFLKRGYQTIPNKQEWIMEWFGEYLVAWDAGLHFFFPFFMERRGRVYVATQGIDLNMDNVTRDGKMSAQVDFKNASAEVIVQLFFRIFDSKKAMYEIDDVVGAVREKMESGIRAYYGSMDIDEAIAKRADVDLRSIITQNATEADFFKEWGVEIVSIAVTDIKLPEGVTNERIKKLTAEKALQVAQINEKKADIDASIEEKLGGGDAKRLKKFAEITSRSVGDVMEYDLKKRQFTAYEKAGILIASDSPNESSALSGAVAGATANIGFNAKQNKNKP